MCSGCTLAALSRDPRGGPADDRHRVTGAAILNVTSSAGLQGTIGQINYSAAKGAITSMTKSAAKELARLQHPGQCPRATGGHAHDGEAADRREAQARFIAQVPLGRFATPEEIAPSFVHIASPAAAYMTGQVVCVDGGLYLAS